MKRMLIFNAKQRAALLLTLVYAFAVLAPAFANALGTASSFRSHHSEQPVAASAYDKAHALGELVPHHNGHSALAYQDDQSSGQAIDDLHCCALGCISALPATLFAVETPVTASERLSSSFVRFESNAPFGPYRPPIH